MESAHVAIRFAGSWRRTCVLALSVVPLALTLSMSLQGAFGTSAFTYKLWGFVGVAWSAREAVVTYGSNVYGPISQRPFGWAGDHWYGPSLVSFYSELAAGEGGSCFWRMGHSRGAFGPLWCATHCWGGVAIQTEVDGAESWHTIVVPLWPVDVLAGGVAAYGIVRFGRTRRRRGFAVSPRSGG
jgi:hypothetical protein